MGIEDRMSETRRASDMLSSMGDFDREDEELSERKRPDETKAHAHRCRLSALIPAE